jgi:hypothetical protein
MEKSFLSRGRKLPELHELAQQVARNFGRVFEAQTLWLDSLDALLTPSNKEEASDSAAAVNQDTPARAPAEVRELAGEEDIYLA